MIKLFITFLALFTISGCGDVGGGGAAPAPESVASATTPVPINVLAPVVGPIRITGPENADCVSIPVSWTFCQTQSPLHVNLGLGGAKDRFAWDMNLLHDADNLKPVFAVAPGRVVRYAGTFTPGQTFGAVLIEHNTNGRIWWSGYLHMTGINVVEGQLVTTDTQLGLISNITSLAPIPNHLHFAAYEGANSIGGLISMNITFTQR